MNEDGRLPAILVTVTVLVLLVIAMSFLINSMEKDCTKQQGKLEYNYVTKQHKCVEKGQHE